MVDLLDNCSYNTIKLLHELSSLAWFIDHHALKDARESGNALCAKQLQLLSQELKKHVSLLTALKQSPTTSTTF